MSQIIVKPGRKPMPHHNNHNCCTFCRIEENVRQNLRRFIYGRYESTSAKSLADKNPGIWKK